MRQRDSDKLICYVAHGGWRRRSPPHTQTINNGWNESDALSTPTHCTFVMTQHSLASAGGPSCWAYPEVSEQVDENSPPQGDQRKNANMSQVSGMSDRSEALLACFASPTLFSRDALLNWPKA